MVWYEIQLPLVQNIPFLSLCTEDHFTVVKSTCRSGKKSHLKAHAFSEKIRYIINSWSGRQEPVALPVPQWMLDLINYNTEGTHIQDAKLFQKHTHTRMHTHMQNTHAHEIHTWKTTCSFPSNMLISHSWYAVSHTHKMCFLISSRDDL